MLNAWSPSTQASRFRKRAPMLQTFVAASTEIVDVTVVRAKGILFVQE